MSVTLHPCPATGCVQSIRTTMLMCHHHWFKVPFVLREQLHAIWTAYHCGKASDDDVRAAQAQAIATVDRPTETTRTANDTVKGGAL